MTKELITEEYSYFSPFQIFRDVRKKKKSKRLQKTSGGSKSERSYNSDSEISFLCVAQIQWGTVTNYFLLQYCT